MVREEWLELELTAAQQVILVVDASAGASLWPTIRTLVGSVVQLSERQGRLPALYFTGNARPYYAPDFEHEATGWLRENAGRGRVLGPVLAREPLQADTALVVLADGAIYDVEDWLEEPALRGALFVRLGSAPLTGGRREELPPKAEALQERLDNPVVRVEFAGRGIMPFWWDNEAYQWDGTKLAAAGVPHFSVKAAFLCALPDSPRAKVALARGGLRTLPLHAGPPQTVGAWQGLPEADARIYRQCVIQRRYTCLACGERHDVAQLTCDRNGPPGRFLYPSLEGLRGRGFVVFRDLGRQVEYRHHACPALRLADGTVALRSGPGAAVFRFEMAQGAWRTTGKPLQAYHPVEQNVLALVL